MEPQEIILEPVITEKSVGLKRNFDTYTFKIHHRANKIEVKKAVEKLFNVRVKKIHTLKVRGKARRVGWVAGRTSGWKKALVTLESGQKIEALEGIL